METDTREVAPSCTACGSEHNGEGALCFSCGPAMVRKPCATCGLHFKAPVDSIAADQLDQCAECYTENVASGGDFESAAEVVSAVCACYDLDTATTGMCEIAARYF